jgi:hypothetical protein
MTPIGIHSPLVAFRHATAELTSSARWSASPAGSIVAVDGVRDWWRRAADAFTAGAVGVVVSRPGPAPLEAVDALAATGRPVVLDRPLLRADVAGHVARALADLPAASVLTVETHAPPGVQTALRDAIGWARVLARGPLVVRAASFNRERGLALLETAGGLPVSLISAAQDDAPPAGRIRIVALAEMLIELDSASGAVSVAMTDSAARHVSPGPYERPERLALRQAIDAVAAGATPSDLADLQHDQARADELSAAARP